MPQWGTDEWFWQQQGRDIEIGLVTARQCHRFHPTSDFVNHFLESHCPSGCIDGYREAVRMVVDDE